MKPLLQAVLTALVLSALVYAADDPLIGTWKMDVSKSNIPTSPPKARTWKIERVGDSYKFTLDEITAAGSTMHVESTFKDDGKDYPVIGNANADAFGLKRVDELHWEHFYKKNGQIVSGGKDVLSNDGKTLTQTLTANNAQGFQVQAVFVLERQ